MDEFVFGNRGGFPVGCAVLTRAPFVSLRDGEGGGGDGCLDAEAASESAGEGGFAGADVADEFEA